MAKSKAGRPSLPPVLKARALAGLAVLIKRHGTGMAVAEIFFAKGHPVSANTINAVRRGYTGPSVRLVAAMIDALGYDPLALTVAEIARRWAP